MKLIIGLGNPGDDYISTRHNLGFMALDHLASKWGVHLSVQSKMKAEIAATMYRGETIILAKPQTFMNLSGRAVDKIIKYYKLSPDDIWVISDDLDLDFGTVRLRVGGSSGGHNGLKDIIEQIGEDFVRIRIGIKNDKSGVVPTEKFVLERFSKAEQSKIESVIDSSVELIEKSLIDGPSHTSQSI